MYPFISYTLHTITIRHNGKYKRFIVYVCKVNAKSELTLTKSFSVQCVPSIFQHKLVNIEKRFKFWHANTE